MCDGDGSFLRLKGKLTAAIAFRMEHRVACQSNTVSTLSPIGDTALLPLTSARELSMAFRSRTKFKADLIDVYRNATQSV